MENKRKLTEKEDMSPKKIKMELCPHAERCYRRNPHHFREYDHPHLDAFLLQGDNFTLPNNFPQSRPVIVEQLAVLKDLNKHCDLKNTSCNTKTSSKINIEINKINSDNKNTFFQSKNKPMKLDQLATTSTSVGTTSSGWKKESKKKTTFVAGQTTYHPKHITAAKMEVTSPYNLFFTTVPDAYATLDHENSITFADLICPSLGELKCSLQLNFMIDVSWLIEQYEVHKVNKKPLTIVYGYDFPGMISYMDKLLPNVKYHMVKMKDPFGIHHSKIGVYSYMDASIRVVVSTANLYYEDWNHYNQGLWVSPKCSPLPEGSLDHDGESSTGFKSSFLNYLKSYKIPILQEWIDCVKKCDFSNVKVFFVASIPGKHYPKDSGCHVYRTQDLLTRHCKIPQHTLQEDGPNAWHINAQASSIGSLGKAPGDWLRSVVLRSLSCRQQSTPTVNSSATINVIFPTVKNVMHSFYGAQGGGCLPYSKNTHEKQLWLQNYLHEWKADATSRTRAMPHIKSYCRISPCKTKLAWFLITSANISKAAWGANIQKDGGVYVRSYEAGVLFLPSFFNEEVLHIKKDGDRKTFPFMYDPVLKPYEGDDYPWCN